MGITVRMASDSTGKSVALRVVLSIVLIVLIAGGGIGAFSTLMSLKKPPARTAGSPPRTAVQVEVATRRAHHEVVGGYGRARPLRAADVAAEVAALVVSVADELEAGSHVDAGAELVRLDDRDFKLALARARSTVRQSQAEVTRDRSISENLDAQIITATSELETSERELDRIRGLARKGAASPSELDGQTMQTSARKLAVLALESRRATSVADVERGKAGLERAEAAVAEAQNNLDRTVIRAPYAGRIVARSAQPGSRVAPGALLFRIVDTTRVEVPIALAAARFGSVRIGARASLRLSESGSVVWEGTVARVSPGVDADSRTFQAFLVVEAPAASGADATAESPVPPGAFVVAEIESTVHQNVFVIPRAAFIGDIVYLATETPSEGSAAEAGSRRQALVHERRPEVLLRLPDVVLARGGLEEGELVVVSNVEDIADGTRVRLIETGAADEANTSSDPAEDGR